jgi:IS4 transposase
MSDKRISKMYQRKNDSHFNFQISNLIYFTKRYFMIQEEFEKNPLINYLNNYVRDVTNLSMLNSDPLQVKSINFLLFIYK